MAYLRFIAVAGVILIPVSFAHATTQDDSYIAGYAAGVLKQSLKLEMPSLNVKDGVITLPTGSLETSETEPKLYSYYRKSPGLMLSRYRKLPVSSLWTILQTLARLPVRRPCQQMNQSYYQQDFYLRDNFSNHYWQIRAGLISQRLTVITRVIILLEKI